MPVLAYRNTDCHIVILRCIGANSFFREKVIFPFEEFLFSCPAESRVDIWTHGLGGAELLDSLSVEELQSPAATSEHVSVEKESLWQVIGVAMRDSELAGV